MGRIQSKLAFVSPMNMSTRHFLGINEINFFIASAETELIPAKLMPYI